MKLAVLALSVILAALKAEATGTGCRDHFVIWDADEEEHYHRLSANSHRKFCHDDLDEFNIEAVPCGKTGSAKMETNGRTADHRTENKQPYMVFGDQPDNDYEYCKHCPYEGNMNGRDWAKGRYEIEATFYENDDGEGDELNTIKASFRVRNCDRR